MKWYACVLRSKLKEAFMPEEIIETPQPAAESKTLDWPKIIMAAVLGFGLLIVAAYAGYWYGTESAKVNPPVADQPLADKTQIPETPTPEATPSPVTDPTTNWKTYKNESVTFKFPPRWIEKPNIIRGSGFTQEFEDPEGKFTFTFSSSGNYNQTTGKPYASIDDFINMPYKAKTVIIDGLEGRQPLPRAGGENINSVMFFSKDSKVIYILELKTGNTSLDTPETDVEKGQKIFSQILSTFKFLD